MDYVYSVKNDTLNGKVATGALYLAIVESSIIIQLNKVNISSDTLTITFAGNISTGEKSTLDSIISSHDGIETVEPEKSYDESGREIVRTAATIKGWHYESREIEVQLSKIDGASSYVGNVKQADISCKIYDINGSEITDIANEANAVRTQVIMSPQYDFEILGGKIHQSERPLVNIRMSVHAGPVQLGVAYCKYFVPSLNLKYINEALPMNTDGRASKYLKKDTTGVPVATNQFEVNFYYPQGSTHELGVIFETFRE